MSQKIRNRQGSPRKGWLSSKIRIECIWNLCTFMFTSPIQKWRSKSAICPESEQNGGISKMSIVLLFLCVISSLMNIKAALEAGNEECQHSTFPLTGVLKCQHSIVVQVGLGSSIAQRHKTIYSCTSNPQKAALCLILLLFANSNDVNKHRGQQMKSPYTHVVHAMNQSHGKTKE